MNNNGSVFYIADKDAIDHIRDEYLENYTKEDILELIKTIQKRFRLNMFSYVNTEGRAARAPQFVKSVFGPSSITTFYMLKKAQLAEALAYFMADPRNDTLLSKSLNQEDDVLKYEIAKIGALRMYEVNKIAGRDAISFNSSLYWRTDVKLRADLKSFRIFMAHEKYTYRIDTEDVFLRLPSKSVDKAVKRVYPLKECVAEIDSDDSDRFLTVNRMARITHMFSVMKAMQNTGTAVPGVTKLMSKSILKKFRDLMGADFEAETVSKLNGIQSSSTNVALDSITLTMFLFMVAMDRDYGNVTMEEDPAKLVKQILTYRNYYSYHSQIVQMLLPGIAGITTSWGRQMFGPVLLDCLFNALSCMEDDKWCPVDNIVYDAYRRLYIQNRELLCNNCESWPEFTYADSKGLKKPVRPDNALRIMTFPLIRGFVFFLTALGVLETAMDQKDSEPDGTPFHALKYTRLTPLGKFALNNGPYVDLTVDQDFARQFELIDNPLIVLSLTPQNPYNNWMNRIGKRTGNRWIVTPKSFLSGCTDIKDIKNTVDDFKRYICAEPSTAWLDFFERMQNNAGKGSMSRDYERYEIYDLNHQNKALIELLSTDRDIRKLYIRAEGYRILVPTENSFEFKLLLREAGFLI